MTSAESRWNGWGFSRQRYRVTVGLTALLICVSCGGVPKTYYYTVQMPPPPIVHNSKTQLTLGVERIRASEVLRDDRIVYYESPTQLNYYEYHRWGSDPATMLSELLRREVSRLQIFKHVRLLPTGESVDYVLKGRLLNFEEVDHESGVRGRVGLELSLVRSGDQKVVWTDSRQVENAAQGKGVAAVVRAINASSEQLFSELLPALAEQMGREITQNSGQSP